MSKPKPKRRAKAKASSPSHGAGVRGGVLEAGGAETVESGKTGLASKPMIAAPVSKRSSPKAKRQARRASITNNMAR